MTSNKYPNWKIEKDGRGYIMTRPDWEAQGIYYAIGVDLDKGEWIAELNTMQTVLGERGWGIAMNQAYGTVLEVVAEAESRARYWIAKRGN